MIFEDCPVAYPVYDQSCESPDLRPILLPMSDYDKGSLEGMINLENFATAFPQSNPFGAHLQQSYNPRGAGQYDFNAGLHDVDGQEYYSDSDLGHSFEPPEMPGARIEHPQPMRATNTRVPQLARKRKASPCELPEAPVQKRVPVAQIQIHEPQASYHHDISGQTTPYSPFIPTPGPNVQYTPGQTSIASPQPGHTYSTSNASQASIAAPSPHASIYSPSFATVKTEPSPRAPTTPAPRPASVASPYAAAHPKLVRTSTIPHSSTPTMVGAANHPMGQAFNPYTIYPHNKATLRLKGDLTAVGKEWDGDVLEARRKLVVFTRSQTGSSIDAEFKVVAPQDWSRSDITVNCIYWKERDQAYVTSVDTIALLEQLVAVRFTVEEKNRIRRNLEGFRPMTVSKAKPDSEEFFKVIMGFPNPKPRNIEKDVKVFPWDILSTALKKIIGKYSASYSSTAAPMITTAPTMVYTSADNTTEYQLEPPPAPAVPFSHHHVPPPMTAFAYESNMLPHANVPYAAGVAPEMSAPTNLPQTQPDAIYGPSHNTLPVGPQQLPMTQPPMSAPAYRAPYFEQPAVYEPHVRMATGSAPPTFHTSYGHVESAEMVTPTTYQAYHR